jgi:hypothetical protein
MSGIASPEARAATLTHGKGYYHLLVYSKGGGKQKPPAATLSLAEQPNREGDNQKRRDCKRHVQVAIRYFHRHARTTLPSPPSWRGFGGALFFRKSVPSGDLNLWLNRFLKIATSALPRNPRARGAFKKSANFHGHFRA